MKLSQEKLPQSQLKLHVEMEAEEMAKAMEAAYRRLAQRVNIPGFRRGKTPATILESYVGREAVISEAIEQLVPQTYRQVAQEKGIEAVAPPLIQVEKREPLTFTAVVPLKPDVILGDYKGLRIESPALAVTDEDIERALEELRYEQAPWEPVERPVGVGDLAIIDVQGWVEGQLYIEEKGFQYQVKPSPLPFPGLAQAVEGMAKGGEREFTLPFPQGHAYQEKECRFRVKLAEVKGREPLPLDDALAQGLNLPDFASLRQEVSRQLKAKAEAESRREQERRVVEAVVSQAKVEYPPILVEWEIRRRLQQQGLEANAERVSQLEPQVAQELVRSLILGKVMETEGIEVTDEEVEAEVSKMAQERGGELQKLINTTSARQSIREALLIRKTVACLVTLAAIEKEVESGG